LRAGKKLERGVQNCPRRVTRGLRVKRARRPNPNTAVGLGRLLKNSKILDFWGLIPWGSKDLDFLVFFCKKWNPLGE